MRNAIVRQNLSIKYQVISNFDKESIHYSRMPIIIDIVKNVGTHANLELLSHIPCCRTRTKLQPLSLNTILA